MDEMTDLGSDEEARKIARRELIRKGAKVGVVAWTTPAVLAATGSPAAALTVPPCEFGPSYVVLYSPDSGTDILTDRPGAYNAPVTVDGCTSLDPLCPPTNPTWTRQLAAQIGLTVANIDISHFITERSTQPVTLSLDADSCCVITKVKAHVHRYGAATAPDCPNPYCQTATVGGTYLQIVGGALGTKSVTVAPNQNQRVCVRPGTDDYVHWGSPNKVCGPGASSNAFANGQPFGYMVVELDCDPKYVGQP